MEDNKKYKVGIPANMLDNKLIIVGTGDANVKLAEKLIAEHAGELNNQKIIIVSDINDIPSQFKGMKEISKPEPFIIKSYEYDKPIDKIYTSGNDNRRQERKSKRKRIKNKKL